MLYDYKEIKEQFLVHLKLDMGRVHIKQDSLITYMTFTGSLYCNCERKCVGFQEIQYRDV